MQDVAIVCSELYKQQEYMYQRVGCLVFITQMLSFIEDAAFRLAVSPWSLEVRSRPDMACAVQTQSCPGDLRLLFLSAESEIAKRKMIRRRGLGASMHSPRTTSVSIRATDLTPLTLTMLPCKQSMLERHLHEIVIELDKCERSSIFHVRV